MLFGFILFIASSFSSFKFFNSVFSVPNWSFKFFTSSSFPSDFACSSCNSVSVIFASVALIFGLSSLVIVSIEEMFWIKDFILPIVSICSLVSLYAGSNIQRYSTLYSGF